MPLASCGFQGASQISGTREGLVAGYSLSSGDCNIVARSSDSDNTSSVSATVIAVAVIKNIVLLVIR